MSMREQMPTPSPLSHTHVVYGGPMSATSTLKWVNEMQYWRQILSVLNSKHQQFHFFHMYIRPCEKSGIASVSNLHM